MKGKEFGLQLDEAMTVIKMHTLFVTYAFWMIIILLKTFFSAKALVKAERLKTYLKYLTSL
jgi:hypothetical protein